MINANLQVGPINRFTEKAMPKRRNIRLILATLIAIAPLQMASAEVSEVVLAQQFGAGWIPPCAARLTRC